MSSTGTSCVLRLRSARAAFLAVVSLLACAGLPTLAGGAWAHTAPAAHLAAGAESQLKVTEVEYRLELSRGAVKAGPVGLQAIDGGLDPHDLRLRGASSSSELASPLLTPGRSWQSVVYLKPGVYRLWCSLPEHARLGMHATLRVVR